MAGSEAMTAIARRPFAFATQAVKLLIYTRKWVRRTKKRLYLKKLALIVRTATNVGTLQHFVFYWKVAQKSRQHGHYSQLFTALNGFILNREVKVRHRVTSTKAINHMLRIAFDELVTRFRKVLKARIKRLNAFSLTVGKSKIGSVAKHVSALWSPQDAEKARLKLSGPEKKERALGPGLPSGPGGLARGHPKARAQAHKWDMSVRFKGMRGSASASAPSLALSERSRLTGVSFSKSALSSFSPSARDDGSDAGSVSTTATSVYSLYSGMSAGGVVCNDWGAAFFTHKTFVGSKNAEKLQKVTFLAIGLAVMHRSRRLFRRWRKRVSTRMHERRVVIKMNRRVMITVLPWMGRLLFLRRKWARVRYNRMGVLWLQWKHALVRCRRERKVERNIVSFWDQYYRAHLLQRVFMVGVREKTRWALGVWKKEFIRVRSNGRRCEAMVPRHKLTQHFACMKVLLKAMKCDNRLMTRRVVLFFKAKLADKRFEEMRLQGLFLRRIHRHVQRMTQVRRWLAATCCLPKPLTRSHSSSHSSSLLSSLLPATSPIHLPHPPLSPLSTPLFIYLPSTARPCTTCTTTLYSAGVCGSCAGRGCRHASCPRPSPRSCICWPTMRPISHCRRATGTVPVINCCLRLCCSSFCCCAVLQSSTLSSRYRYCAILPL